jgi:Flp pilus assembly protein TadG
MRTIDKTKGQSLAELAISLPLLLLVVMGVFDLGRGIFYYSTIHNAAREGARFGAVDHCDSTGIQDIVETHAYSLLDGLTISDTIMYFDAKPERIVVTVTYTFETITPLIGTFFDDGSVELVSQSRQLIEQPVACP